MDQEFPLPEDPELREIAEALTRLSKAAEIYDTEWRLRFVTQDLRVLIGEDDPERLGADLHIADVRGLDTWAQRVTPETGLRFAREEAPYVFSTAEAIEAWMASIVERESSVETLAYVAEHPEELPTEFTVRDHPAVDGYSFSFLRGGDLPEAHITRLSVRLSSASGRHLGFLYLYTPSLASPVLDLVARGDPGMFGRMVEMLVPGRRAAAILFADLQGSSTLSRRLSTAAFFELIRDLTTMLDGQVNAHGGIPGKHAGDGVTALFLAEQFGSASAAARAAIEAGREMSAAAAELHAGSAAPVLNVGLHWGASLYVGQLVTGGRLEVTALGDEMNEAARIEQSARDGAILASKPLVEQLDPADAEAVDLLAHTTYELLGELEGAPEKARRDAGTLPVCDVARR